MIVLLMLVVGIALYVAGSLLEGFADRIHGRRRR